MGDQKEIIYRLEDHHLLQGCIAIFKLDNRLSDYAYSFNKVFTLHWDYKIIGMALLTFGDYTQKWGNWFNQLGISDKTWRELFTPSNYKHGFLQTQKVLYALMAHLFQNPQSNLNVIVEDYLTSFERDVDKPKDWKYYFIKYPEFRNNEGGFYYWPNSTKPYECTMMRRTTLGGFHWSPFLYALKDKFKNHLNLDSYGAPLLLTKDNSTLKILHVIDGFRLEALDDEGEKLLEEVLEMNYLNSDNIFQISQNEEGIDIEDRIEKGAAFLSKIINI